MVMGPSNKMALCGFVGFFGWLAFIVLLIIPALFPITEDLDKPKPVMKIGPALAAVGPIAGGGLMGALGPAGGGDTEKKKMEEEKSSFFQMIASIDISLLCEMEWYFFLMTLIPIILLMFFAALVAYGAIQMQIWSPAVGPSPAPSW